MQVQAVKIYNNNNPNSIYQYKHTNHSVNNNSKNNISFGSKLMLNFVSLETLSHFPKKWQQTFIKGLNSIEKNGEGNSVLVDSYSRVQDILAKECSGKRCMSVPYFEIGITNEKGSHFVAFENMITTPEQECYREVITDKQCIPPHINFFEFLKFKNIQESDVSQDIANVYKAVKKKLNKRLPDDALNRELNKLEYRGSYYDAMYKDESKISKEIKERISKLAGNLGIIDESKGNHNNPIVLQPDFWQNLEYSKYNTMAPLRWLDNESFEFLSKQLDSLKDLKHDNIICIGYKNRGKKNVPFEFMYDYLTMSIIEKRGNKFFISEEPINTFLFDSHNLPASKPNLVDFYHEAHAKLVPVAEEDSEIYNYYYDLIYRNFKPQSNKSDTIKETAKEVSKQPIISDSEKTEKVSQSNILDKIKGLSKEEFEILYKQMTELHQSKG